MAYMQRWRICQGCLKPKYGRLPPGGDYYCMMCKLDHSENAARQMASREGPYYDRWLQSRGARGRPRND